MSVAAPPRGPDTERDRDLEERVADLEALIEEARRRTRRRRIRNVTAFVVVAAGVAAGLIGFHGGGGGGTGTAALTGGSSARGQASQPSPALAPLPQGNRAFAFAFDPQRPNIVYVASPDARGGVYVYKTTDAGSHWQSTGARGTGWMSDILSLTSDLRHPGTLYAGTDTAIYKTVNGGRSWQPFNQGLFPSQSRVCYPASVGAPRYCVKIDKAAAKAIISCAAREAVSRWTQPVRTPRLVTCEAPSPSEERNWFNSSWSATDARGRLKSWQRVSSMDATPSPARACERVDAPSG